MILRAGPAIRTAITSFVLILAFSTACDDGTPFRVRKPGWDFLGLDGLRDANIRVLELKRPYLYVCAGRDGLYKGVVARTNPMWQCLGFADSTMGGGPQAGGLSRGELPPAIEGTGVRDVAVLENRDILAAVDYRQRIGSQATRLPQVYRSENMGTSWQRSDSGMTIPSYGHGIRCLEVSPCSDVAVFAGSGAWFFRSLDNGISWIPTASFAFVEDVQVHPKDGSVWAGGGTMLEMGVLLKSVDGGLSWEFVKPVLDMYGAWPYGFEVSHIALDPGDPDVVYVLTPWGGVNKTEDGGQVWITPFFYSKHRTGDIVLDPRDPQHLFIGFGSVVHESTDGGETYEALEVPDGSNVIDMEYDAHGADLYVATDGGIYRYRTR